MTRLALTAIPDQLSVGSVNVTGTTVPANGISLSNANTVAISSNSTNQFFCFGTSFGGFNANGPSMVNAAASGTSPTLFPRRPSSTTGIGSQAAGNMSFIATGAEIERVTANGTITILQTLVSALPAAATAGAGTRRFVTDALTPVFAAAVTGGGAVFTPVYSDGTIWRCG